MKSSAFSLDDRSGVPVYVQLREQVLGEIARGALGAGDQLPTVREVAIALSINPNTVNRAYAELERTGVLSTQRGRGTFLTDHRVPQAQQHRSHLVDLVTRFIAHARSLGFTPTEIERAVDSQLKKPQ